MTSGGATVELEVGVNLDTGTVDLTFYGRTATLSPDEADEMADALLAGAQLTIAGPGHAPLEPADAAAVADALHQWADCARHIRTKFN